MTTRLKLVQNDTRPPVVANLFDDNGPIDISAAGTSVQMLFRAEGSTTVIATIVGSKLTGYQDPVTGIINYNAPYNVAGVGGRCQFPFAGTTALDNPPGNYEAEVQILFADGTLQTVYDLLKFKMRPAF